jgi:hypothetical protein
MDPIIGISLLGLKEKHYIPKFLRFKVQLKVKKQEQKIL